MLDNGIKQPKSNNYNQIKSLVKNIAKDNSTEIHPLLVQKAVQYTITSQDSRSLMGCLIDMIDQKASHSYIVYKCLFIIEACLQKRSSAFLDIAKNFSKEIRLLTILSFEGKECILRPQIHQKAFAIYNYLAYNKELSKNDFEQAIQTTFYKPLRASNADKKTKCIKITTSDGFEFEDSDSNDEHLIWGKQMTAPMNSENQQETSNPQQNANVFNLLDQNDIYQDSENRNVDETQNEKQNYRITQENNAFDFSLFNQANTANTANVASEPNQLQNSPMPAQSIMQAENITTEKDRNSNLNQPSQPQPQFNPFQVQGNASQQSVQIQYQQIQPQQTISNQYQQGQVQQTQYQQGNPPQVQQNQYQQTISNQYQPGRTIQVQTQYQQTNPNQYQQYQSHQIQQSQYQQTIPNQSMQVNQLQIQQNQYQFQQQTISNPYQQSQFYQYQSQANQFQGNTKQYQQGQQMQFQQNRYQQQTNQYQQQSVSNPNQQLNMAQVQNFYPNSQTQFRLGNIYESQISSSAPLFPSTQDQERQYQGIFKPQPNPFMEMQPNDYQQSTMMNISSNNPSTNIGYNDNKIIQIDQFFDAQPNGFNNQPDYPNDRTNQTHNFQHGRNQFTINYQDQQNNFTNHQRIQINQQSVQIPQQNQQSILIMQQTQPQMQMSQLNQQSIQSMQPNQQPAQIPQQNQQSTQLIQQNQQQMQIPQQNQQSIQSMQQNQQPAQISQQIQMTQQNQQSIQLPPYNQQQMQMPQQNQFQMQTIEQNRQSIQMTKQSLSNFPTEQLNSPQDNLMMAFSDFSNNENNPTPIQQSDNSIIHGLFSMQAVDDPFADIQPETDILANLNFPQPTHTNGNNTQINQNGGPQNPNYNFDSDWDPI